MIKHATHRAHIGPFFAPTLSNPIQYDQDVHNLHPIKKYLVLNRTNELGCVIITILMLTYNRDKTGIDKIFISHNLKVAAATVLLL